MDREDTRTLRELAQQALDVQNASNLTGVLNAWFRAACRLRVLLGDSTTHLHHHPITRVWSDKVASLCGTQALDVSLMQEFNAVERMAKGEES